MGGLRAGWHPQLVTVMFISIIWERSVDIFLKKISWTLLNYWPLDLVGQWRCHLHALDVVPL